MTVHVSEQALARLGEQSWAANWTLGGPGFYGELLQPATRDVWLCQTPLTAEQYDALELPGGFIRSGFANCLHDAAFFQRSPGADVDGPVETAEVGGSLFARVARPVGFEASNDGLLTLEVEKHHRVFFNAGQTIELLDTGDGQVHLPMLNQLVAAGVVEAGGVARTLPAGWSVRQLGLTEELVAEIPCPARVLLFASGDGFHGPVSSPALRAA